MAIKNVTKGERISAIWANSIVDTVNAMQGVDLRGTSAAPTAKGIHRPYQPHSQFLIKKLSDLSYSIEAGSIFIDGTLIECSEHGNFQYCSLIDYDKNSVYKPQNSADLPIWYIDIFTTKDTKKQKHIAYLKVKNHEAPFEDTSVSGYSFNNRFVLNTVDIEKCEVKQIVSGSMYLSTIGADGGTVEQISLIAGDGIHINEHLNAYEICAKISLISTDNLIYVNQKTEPDKTIMLELTLNSDIMRDDISIIGGDNIRVDYKSPRTYTIHNTQSIIAGDGIFISKIDGDDIYIALDTPSTINVDGIVTMNGSHRIWGEVGEGASGADLCSLQIDKSTYTLRVERVSDANGQNFLKFGF